MIKTHILLCKTARTGKKVPENISGHSLFYSELAPTDPWPRAPDFTWTKKTSVGNVRWITSVEKTTWLERYG